MFAAVITVFLFALSGISNQRVAMRLGAMLGNFVRLTLATIVLGLIVLVFFPDSLAKPTFTWYFVSGIIGFGLGDVALFIALERIGSRLAVLLTVCLAPLFAIVLEWLWLGNAITAPVFGATAAILVGVVLALKPGSGVAKSQRRGNPKVGVIAGVISGLGQGTGAVISRKAEDVERAFGVDVNGLSAAYQRVMGGLVIAMIVTGIVWLVRRRNTTAAKKKLDLNQVEISPKALAFWVLASAICGPIIGVSCFQWALETASSGVVLAIVAMTPIVMMPLAAITEKDHPTRMAIAGAVIAVAGVSALYYFSA